MNIKQAIANRILQLCRENNITLNNFNEFR